MVTRTTRDISKIPGMSTFRLHIEYSSPEPQMVHIGACGLCDEIFGFAQCTPWGTIERVLEKHQLSCDRKRATASANAKKRWEKERERRANAHPQPLKTEDISIKLKRRAIAETQASRKACRTLPERILLEEDPWTITKTLDPKHIQCAACGHTITLNRRRQYYPGLWLKHKARCGGIHQRFVRANVMLLPIIRRRFMILQSRRRRFRYISNGSAKLFARQSEVEDDPALAEQSGDKVLDVVDSVSSDVQEGATVTDDRGFEVEAVAAQPAKTASRWWNTVLGPSTGESQPMAHSRTECPVKHQAPHSAQSDDRGNACWTSATETSSFNKSGVESPKYDPPVTPKASNYQGGDRFRPVMVCRSESPRLVQVRSDRDHYRVPGSVVDKGVGRWSNQASFQELNSGFARCGDVGSTSSMPLNGYRQCMVRGDALGFGRYGTYVSQQRAGPADMCFGSPLVNISALSRPAPPNPSIDASSGPSSFHQRGPLVEPNPLRTFNYSSLGSRSAPQGGLGAFRERLS